MRSSQPYVKFRQISSTRHKQLEIELSILKIDMVLYFIIVYFKVRINPLLIIVQERAMNMIVYDVIYLQLLI